MDQFKSFITEEKHESYRILVISSETSPGKKPLHRTARRFVDEAKKRNLQCNVNKGFRSYVLACLWGKPQLPEYCEELKDIRGPYKTEELCKKRVYEIVDEMPSHRPHMQPRGYRCEKM